MSDTSCPEIAPIHLTANEAEALLWLSRKVGGHPTDSLRGDVDRVSLKIEQAGGAVRDHEELRLDGHSLTGELFFVGPRKTALAHGTSVSADGLVGVVNEIIEDWFAPGENGYVVTLSEDYEASVVDEDSRSITTTTVKKGGKVIRAAGDLRVVS